MELTLAGLLGNPEEIGRKLKDLKVLFKFRSRGGRIIKNKLISL